MPLNRVNFSAFSPVESPSAMSSVPKDLKVERLQKKLNKCLPAVAPAGGPRRTQPLGGA